LQFCQFSQKFDNHLAWISILSLMLFNFPQSKRQSGCFKKCKKCWLVNKTKITKNITNIIQSYFANKYSRPITLSIPFWAAREYPSLLPSICIESVFSEWKRQVSNLTTALLIFETLISSKKGYTYKCWFTKINFR